MGKKRKFSLGARDFRGGGGGGGGRRKKKEKKSQPILVSPGAHSLSVATLAVVGDGRGVDVWVALRLSYH